MLHHERMVEPRKSEFHLFTETANESNSLETGIKALDSLQSQRASFDSPEHPLGDVCEGLSANDSIVIEGRREVGDLQTVHISVSLPSDSTQNS